MTSFMYQSADDLLTSQQILIDLAEHLLEYIDKVPKDLSLLYEQCLSKAVVRGEFQLNFVGFDEDEASPLNLHRKDSSNRAQDVKNTRQKKAAVAISYQRFMYSTLGYVLKLVDLDGLDESKKNFAAMFCAIAYFRIPEFRERLLKRLESTKDEKVVIPELRDTEWQLTGEADDQRKKNQDIISLFDWEKIFYFHIKVNTKIFSSIGKTLASGIADIR